MIFPIKFFTFCYFMVTERMYCGICLKRKVKGLKGDDFKLTKCPDCHRWYCRECGSTKCQECIREEVLKNLDNVNYEPELITVEDYVL